MVSGFSNPKQLQSDTQNSESNQSKVQALDIDRETVTEEPKL
jgi:hypothetical protein